MLGDSCIVASVIWFTSLRQAVRKGQGRHPRFRRLESNEPVFDFRQHHSGASRSANSGTGIIRTKTTFLFSWSPSSPLHGHRAWMTRTGLHSVELDIQLPHYRVLPLIPCENSLSVRAPCHPAIFLLITRKRLLMPNVSVFALSVRNNQVIPETHSR